MPLSNAQVREFEHIHLRHQFLLQRLLVIDKKLPADAKLNEQHGKIKAGVQRLLMKQPNPFIELQLAYKAFEAEKKDEEQYKNGAIDKTVLQDRIKDRNEKYKAAVDKWKKEFEQEAVAQLDKFQQAQSTAPLQFSPEEQSSLNKSDFIKRLDDLHHHLYEAKGGENPKVKAKPKHAAAKITYMLSAVTFDLVKRNSRLAKEISALEREFDHEGFRHADKHEKEIDIQILKSRLQEAERDMKMLPDTIKENESKPEKAEEIQKQKARLAQLPEQIKAKKAMIIHRELQEKRSKFETNAQALKDAQQLIMEVNHTLEEQMSKKGVFHKGNPEANAAFYKKIYEASSFIIKNFPDMDDVAIKSIMDLAEHLQFDKSRPKGSQLYVAIDEKKLDPSEKHALSGELIDVRVNAILTDGLRQQARPSSVSVPTTQAATRQSGSSQSPSRSSLRPSAVSIAKRTSATDSASAGMAPIAEDPDVQAEYKALVDRVQRSQRESLLIPARTSLNPAEAKTPKVSTENLNQYPEVIQAINTILNIKKFDSRDKLQLLEKIKNKSFIQPLLVALQTQPLPDFVKPEHLSMLLKLVNNPQLSGSAEINRFKNAMSTNDRINLQIVERLFQVQESLPLEPQIEMLKENAKLIFSSNNNALLDPLKNIVYPFLTAQKDIRLLPVLEVANNILKEQLMLFHEIMLDINQRPSNMTPQDQEARQMKLKETLTKKLGRKLTEVEKNLITLDAMTIRINQMAMLGCLYKTNVIQPILTGNHLIEQLKADPISVAGLVNDSILNRMLYGDRDRPMPPHEMMVNHAEVIKFFRNCEEIILAHKKAGKILPNPALEEKAHANPNQKIDLNSALKLGYHIAKKFNNIDFLAANFMLIVNSPTPQVFSKIADGWFKAISTPEIPAEIKPKDLAMFFLKFPQQAESFICEKNFIQRISLCDSATFKEFIGKLKSSPNLHAEFIKAVSSELEKAIKGEPSIYKDFPKEKLEEIANLTGIVLKQEAKVDLLSAAVAVASAAATPAAADPFADAKPVEPAGVVASAVTSGQTQAPANALTEALGSVATTARTSMT